MPVKMNALINRLNSYIKSKIIEVPLTHSTHKISIIGGLLLMGLTLITGIAVYNVMREQIESSLGRGLDVALQGKGHLLESQIEKGLSDTYALAIRPFLLQSMLQLNSDPDDVNALSDLKKNVHSLTQSGFSAAAVYDKHGHLLSKAGQFSEKHAQSLLLNKQDNTSLIWDGEFILHIKKDVFGQDGQWVGSITTESALPKLTRSFGEIRSIGETGEFILCAPPKENKLKMACLISQTDGIKFKYLMRAVEDGILPISYALDGKSGVIAVRDYRDVPVIEAYAPLPEIGLGMSLKLDKEELYKPVTKELKIIILYLAGLIAAEILLLHWLIRKLIDSEREAQNAKEKAEQFSDELSLKESELRERLKEMTCLYEIRRSIGMELSLETVCRQIFKQLIPAMQYPENASVVIEIDDKQITSNQGRLDRVRNPTHKLTSNVNVNGKTCGQLSVLYPVNTPFLIQEEQRLIDAITSDLARWLEHKQVDELLHERLKEITCLYEIRRGMNLELSVDKVCQNIFKHLIPAMQFPEIATAVIELDEQRFTSTDLNPHSSNTLASVPEHSQKVCFDCYRQRDTIGFVIRSNINVNGKSCGHLGVYYPEDKPFLVQEEQKLINAIASDLESWLERKRLEQALVFVAEEQAHTIGQELHDNLGQQIAAIGYQAGALEKKIFATGNEKMASVAASIASQVQTAVIQIKQLAQGLLPFELEANGLIAALEKLAKRISSTYSITCHFSCEHEIMINDKNIALNFYRIAQEAANNAIRHGAAQHLTISLSSAEAKLILSISDDGCGFAAKAKQAETQGMGIKIMQYRARQLGAKLEFLPRTQGGTEVRLAMRMA